MAETAAVPAVDNKELGKKCAFTGKALKRRKRYYRNGKYYISKTAFKSAMKKQQEEQAKAAPAQEPAKQ